MGHGIRYLLYHQYCRGRAGLSNGIMSLELGVILSHITGRVLILEGNGPPSSTPPCGNRLSNTYRSRVTDLFEMPVPWMPLSRAELTSRPQEWFPQGLFQAVFYYPAKAETDTANFKSFQSSRPFTFTYADQLHDVEVLALSGGRPTYQGNRLGNFGLYSSFIYADEALTQKVAGLLRRMRPRKYLRDLAARVAESLGNFNAVHVRRGDFKRTAGTSTLLRRPAEVIERLDHSFPRNQRLAILTDEMTDPFFAPILEAYPDCVFLDDVVLNEFNKEFRDLPQHDATALALLSQLVAAEAVDFVGSMKSTFTGLIQRRRGNLGKDERFKFLWSEVGEDGAAPAGLTAPSSLVPLHPNGEMVEQYEGPFSWNRYSSRIENSWMREWPESFILNMESRTGTAPIAEDDISAGHCKAIIG